MPIIPISNEPIRHDIRYVVAPGHLAYVSVLTGQSFKFVVNADILRKVVRLRSRAVLGSTTITDAQLRKLTGAIPERPRKEVPVDDARIAIV